MPPVRFKSIFLATGFFATAIIILSSSTGPNKPIAVETPQARGSSTLQSTLSSIGLSSLGSGFHISYRTSSHKPPEQQNSTSGGASWYSDWTWLNPFSSSITLDEDRAVLPPLRERPPIYTYYDTTGKGEVKTVETDEKLLWTWKRAWWAAGFRPVILGRGDAMNNPFYKQLQMENIETTLEFEFARWLAWGHMGTGLLASWHCFPMAQYDDPLLSFLRRGQYPQLVRFDGLGAGLFAGEKNEINEAIKDALHDKKLKESKTALDVIRPEKFRVEKPTSIAHYDSNTITNKYKPVAEKLVASPNEGRLALIDLINAHLHGIWQSTFTDGVAVLKPLPKHTTALTAPSWHLANLLAQCAKSIIPASCPPNNPKCAPCLSNKFPVKNYYTFRNSSTLYNIGTVPHPYTINLLNNQTDHLTLAHVRRYTKRDLWLIAATDHLLGSGRGGPSRVVGLKEAVASDFGLSRGLWMAAENVPDFVTTGEEKWVTSTKQEHQVVSLSEEWLANLDWHFGFAIPRTKTDRGEAAPPIPGPERQPKTPPGLPEEIRKSYDPDPPTDSELKKEKELLAKAKEVVIKGEKGKGKADGRMKTVVEAWNLADTEAWKFVRAWRARGIMERLKWEEDEKGFGETKGKGRWW
ncbi:MAG: hypothetical protein Q9160_001936 [Pyrenula sp. 1 TL-2023]